MQHKYLVSDKERSRRISEGMKRSWRRRKHERAVKMLSDQLHADATAGSGLGKKMFDALVAAGVIVIKGGANNGTRTIRS